MSDKKAEENIERYLKTSIYTYAGAYKELLSMLPDDIAVIGRLVCDQITHPSMYFTEPSVYLEDTYYGKFASYPKHRFKNEDELYITAVAMIAGIFYLDEAGFGQDKDVTKKAHRIMSAGFHLIQCNTESKGNTLPFKSWLYGFW